jgi:hypothetical protein
MQANGMSGGSSGDLAVERAILALAMAVYPVLCTVPELARKIGDRDAVERATESLVEHGVIRMHGNTLIPTPAALHCHRLEAW